MHAHFARAPAIAAAVDARAHCMQPPPSTAIHTQLHTLPQFHGAAGGTFVRTFVQPLHGLAHHPRARDACRDARLVLAEATCPLPLLLNSRPLPFASTTTIAINLQRSYTCTFSSSSTTLPSLPHRIQIQVMTCWWHAAEVKLTRPQCAMKGVRGMECHWPQARPVRSCHYKTAGWYTKWLYCPYSGSLEAAGHTGPECVVNTGSTSAMHGCCADVASAPPSSPRSRLQQARRQSARSCTRPRHPEVRSAQQGWHACPGGIRKAHPPAAPPSWR